MWAALIALGCALAAAASGAGCAGDCTPEAEVRCVDSTQYFYDSCGQRGDVSEQCAHGCAADGSACCQPACDGRACGDDGCSGSCGTCGTAQVCEQGLCRCEFTPCGEACCAQHEVCLDGRCEAVCVDECPLGHIRCDADRLVSCRYSDLGCLAYALLVDCAALDPPQECREQDGEFGCF